VDPDSELIDDVIVTPANTHDAEPAADLLAEFVNDDDDNDVADKPIVFGDSAYAGADTLDDLGQAGFDVRAKVPPARGRDGRFGKDDFDLDLEQGTVGCPAGHVAPIRPTPYRGWPGRLRRPLCDLPAARPMHDVWIGPLSHRPSQRGTTPAAQGRSGRPRMAAGVSWHSAQGGTQNRPLRAGRMGRAQGAHPRTTTSVDRR
jgi:Transposase DDE domain